ncbi:MAG: hypothetical protein SOX26_02530 [Phocaeicola sp.]|nr:hypothetical protein [Phocaeicola sp.]
MKNIYQPIYKSQADKSQVNKQYVNKQYVNKLQVNELQQIKDIASKLFEQKTKRTNE